VAAAAASRRARIWTAAQPTFVVIKVVSMNTLPVVTFLAINLRPD
jgi:hypothetical protein